MNSLNFSPISAGRDMRVTDVRHDQDRFSDSQRQIRVPEKPIKETDSKATSEMASSFSRVPLSCPPNQYIERFPVPHSTGDVVPNYHEISQLTALMRAHSDFDLQMFEPFAAGIAADFPSTLRETADGARAAHRRTLSFNLELPGIGATRVDVIVDNERGVVLELFPLNQELSVDSSIARAVLLQLATKLAANRDIFCVRCRTYCFKWTGSADYDDSDGPLH